MTNGGIPHQVENETKAQLPSKQGTSPEQTSALEESIYKVSGHLSTISRNQKYFRTRENRNFATVESTEKRIVHFSMIQIGLIIAMGGLQVFVVRFFFQVYRPLSSDAEDDHTNVADHRARARDMSKPIRTTRGVVFLSWGCKLGLHKTCICQCWV